MADRFPGGVISKTPPTVVAPVDGEGGSASGVWTLDEVLGYEKAGAWPKGLLPRELYAWGYNFSGQVGDNTTTYRSSPVQVDSDTTWQSASSWNHTVSVKLNGSLWAWGTGGDGQLGLNSVTKRSSPVQVGALTNWAQVSAGDNFSASVKTDGSLWVWGKNGKGQLALSDAVDRSSPVQLGALTNWAQVSCGQDHCQAIKTDGTLWSWGDGANGKLGLNDSAPFPGTVSRSSPVQVGSLTNWSSVSAGTSRSGAIKTDGTLWCWGINQAGQLGDNTAVTRSSPVQIGSDTNWKSVSHALAQTAHAGAVKTNGQLYMWGYGGNGAMGTNVTTVYLSSPVQIGSLTNWSTIKAGLRHNVSVKTDGTLWTWGRNDRGTLGDDTTISRSSPIQVGSLTNWSFATAGTYTNAAIIKG
jgi:alpha-tubulin suppressor-like RCC1 family protein